MPYTCECGQKFDLTAALDALPSDRMGSSGMLSPVCGKCGQSIEIRLNNGAFEVGCSYFGGSMHFEAMHRIQVSGLKIESSGPDDIDVTLGNRQWHFGIRHISSQRFCVFQQAFAAGRQIGELDFGQWGVSLTGIERNGISLELHPDIIVEAEDFLLLRGPGPYLTRAWHYINDGRANSSQEQTL